jgi:metallo-beta-lactamase family protein
VALTYHDAGHILGSALVQLDYREDGRDRRFLFTGDLGRREMGLLHNPTIVKDIDVLVSESTYGNKELDPVRQADQADCTRSSRGDPPDSKIVIPAFSLGRTQRMVYCFLELFALHKVRPSRSTSTAPWPCA